MHTYEIPPTLLDDIDAGRCVAFVGAGFSAAARLPTWTELLRHMAEDHELDLEVERFVRETVAGRHPTAHELDQAAQLLEDSLGRERFIGSLGQLLRGDSSTESMRRRLKWLRGIPFRAIVTTNFDTVLDGEVPGPASYHALLRPREFRWWERAFWGDENAGAPVLKLHGDLARPDATDHVVLTRRDYRRRLYGDPGYMTFLRGLLSTNTVLFMGFSFEDAYLNELRSQVLALFDYHEHQRDGRPSHPLAYAILHDVPDLVKLHFERHEGIRVLNFDSGDPPRFGGFDRFLEAIWSQTALLPRFGRLLANRRILWLDPHPHNNEAGYRFLERAAQSHASREGPALENVATVDRALDELRGGSYELVITHWGEGDAIDDAGRPTPNAVRLLECMRGDDLRCPVVIISRDYDIGRRRREALALGAQAYCFTWEALFRTIDQILRPGSETGS